jgi:hypothetical protein
MRDIENDPTYISSFYLSLRIVHMMAKNDLNLTTRSDSMPVNVRSRSSQAMGTVVIDPGSRYRAKHEIFNNSTRPQEVRSLVKLKLRPLVTEIVTRLVLLMPCYAEDERVQNARFGCET